MVSNLLSLAKVLELELLVSEVINCFAEAILPAWIRVHVLFFSLLYSQYLSLWPNKIVMRLDRTFSCTQDFNPFGSISQFTIRAHKLQSYTMCTNICQKKTES